jgi:hypothetical protein
MTPLVSGLVFAVLTPSLGLSVPLALARGTYGWSAK